MQAHKQARQQAKTAENDFFRDDSSREKGLGTHKPEDRHVVAGIVEWHCGKHQRGANHTQHNERLAPAFGEGQLGQKEFERTDDEQREISEFRLDGLKLHNAEEEEDV